MPDQSAGWVAAELNRVCLVDWRQELTAGGFMRSIARAAVLLLWVTVAAWLSGCGSGPSGQIRQIQQLQITTGALSNGVVQTPYSEMIQASGGVAPFRWSVGSGTLPHNLSLSSNANTATISGTPDTAVQGLVFTITIIDASNQSASQSYTVSILLGADSLTLSSPSLNFTPQLVGTATGTQVLTLSNVSSSILAFNSIAITGTNAADFNQTNTCGSGLAAGANCTVTVKFTPGQLGTRSASITISDDTTGSPQSVSLNGVGLVSGTNATLSANSLDFGTGPVGGSTTRSITLANYGTTLLGVVSIAASGNFSETDNCLPSVASGATCTVKVTFSPNASGPFSGTLSVSDSAAGSPQTVSLNGTGHQYTLTGQCIEPNPGGPLPCRSQQIPDTTQCPVGQPAISPVQDSCAAPNWVDDSRACGGGLRPQGLCVATF
jgi:hypothetical protein